MRPRFILLVVAQGVLAQDFKQGLGFKLDDGVTGDFVSEVMMKSVFQTALLRGEHHLESNARRLQGFVKNLKEHHPQSPLRRLQSSDRRRSNVNADTISGAWNDDASASKTEAIGGVGTQASCSMPDMKISCVTATAKEEWCTILGTGEKNAMQKSTGVEECICTECPKAGEFIDGSLAMMMDHAGAAARGDSTRKFSEKDLQIKGIDEIAGLCNFKEPIECIFGGTKTQCKAMVADLEANTNTPSGQPTPTQAMNDYVLPALKCLCDDCKYPAFANAISPIAKKLLEQENMFPVFQEMATAFCANVETVKCITSMDNKCVPGAPEMTAEMKEAQKAVNGGLDCMCKSCPNALGKVLTMAEKQEKGEYTSEADQMADLCDMYPDAQCLMTASNCQDGVKMAASNMGEDVSKADDVLAQLKTQCEANGIKVKEYTGTPGGEADGAIRMQGAPPALALLMLVFAWTA